MVDDEEEEDEDMINHLVCNEHEKDDQSACLPMEIASRPSSWQGSDPYGDSFSSFPSF